MTRTFSPEYVSAAARVLGVLSNETRLHVVLLLAQGEANVTELCDALNVPQSSLSHHLRILRNTGLVSDRRDGRFVLYRINTAAWTRLAHGFFDTLLEGEDEVTLQDFSIRRLDG